MRIGKSDTDVMTMTLECNGMVEKRKIHLQDLSRFKNDIKQTVLSSEFNSALHHLLYGLYSGDHDNKKGDFEVNYRTGYDERQIDWAVGKESVMGPAFEDWGIDKW